jgi:YidC/Oxa1 family membrane protein insertase
VSTPPMNQLPPLGKSKDKFTPELRILVASLLSMAVILLWAKFFGPKPPANPPQQNQPAQVSTATPGNAAPANTPTAVAAPPKISAAATPAVPPTADSQERTIVVENALYRVEFSNRGAVVKSWQLKNYKDDSKPQKTLDLVHPQAAAEVGGWPFALIFDDPQLGTLANSGLYKISSDANSVEAPADLTFTWSEGNLLVTNNFIFYISYTVNF